MLPQKKAYDLNAKDFFGQKMLWTPFPKLQKTLTQSSIDINKMLQRSCDWQVWVTSMISHSCPHLCLFPLILKLKLCGDRDLSTNGAHLKTAVTQLPELMAHKATLDSHMNITTALLEQIKSCGLDELFSTEEVINKQTVATVLKYLCLLKGFNDHWVADCRWAAGCFTGSCFDCGHPGTVIVGGCRCGSTVYYCQCQHHDNDDNDDNDKMTTTMMITMTRWQQQWQWWDDNDDDNKMTMTMTMMRQQWQWWDDDDPSYIGSLLWEKHDACAGNEWDSSGLWANTWGRPNVFTCFMYYLEWIGVSMMNGRGH